MTGSDAGEESLESLLARLEATIGRLADQAAPLDRLVADYEEALRLVNAANARLEAARSRMAKLQAAGGPTREP
jgi:exodeoxyribonuclease VII small subunit